jgi:hypothetical protein
MERIKSSVGTLQSLHSSLKKVNGYLIINAGGIGMEFELNKTQKDIQKAVRDFVKGEFDKDLAFELEKKHEFPRKIWKKACDLGLLGVHFPEKYSGQGLGSLEDILVIEELCRGDSTIGSAVALAPFASELIMHYGSDEQKKSTCPPWPRVRCSPPVPSPNRTTVRTSPS